MSMSLQLQFEVLQFTNPILPLFVFNAQVVTHPRKGYGGVERDPPVGEEPMHNVVETFPHEKRKTIHQIAHLHNNICLGLDVST